MMEESHVDSKYWPSPKGQAKQQCCGSCFNPAGCQAPCYTPPPGPTPKPIPVPLRELSGVWADTHNNTYNMSIDLTNDWVTLTTVACPHCNWDTAVGIVTPDGLDM